MQSHDYYYYYYYFKRATNEENFQLNLEKIKACIELASNSTLECNHLLEPNGHFSASNLNLTQGFIVYNHRDYYANIYRSIH